VTTSSLPGRAGLDGHPKPDILDNNLKRTLLPPITQRPVMPMSGR